MCSCDDWLLRMMGRGMRGKVLKTTPRQTRSQEATERALAFIELARLRLDALDGRDRKRAWRSRFLRRLSSSMDKESCDKYV